MEQMPLNEQLSNIYENSELELNDLLLEKTRSTAFRCQVKWYEDGERNSKYFYNLEKSKSSAKTCSKLLLEDGKETTNSAEILNKQKDFYCRLYSKDDTVSFDASRFQDCRKISDYKKQEFSENFSYSEVTCAVADMKNGKAPGPDGLSAEIYKVLWQQIGPIFYDAMLEMYEQGVYREAKKGILNLIPKANKDTRVLSNLRPITLLNTDYKLLEKCIANRMDQVMDEIIDIDQKGFMKGRRISTNIRKLLDLIRHCNKNSVPAFVLSLDFKKCFDMISFEIIQGSLEVFGFPSYMRRWVELLYSNFEVRIQNNGHLSTPIKIERSCHQGGCVSSYLFLCCAELLAHCLRENKKIKGIPISDIIYLLNQFADDTDITSLFDQVSLENISRELHRFRDISGFQISYDKTAILRIGSLHGSQARLYTQDPIAWTNDSLNVLGIDIFTEERKLLQNYDSILPKVASILKSWSNRGLSLMGKINIVNTLIASLYVYKMTVLPNMAKSQIDAVESEIVKFVWNGRRSKIPLKVLKLPKNEGGMQLVDLNSKQNALKVSWVQTLAHDSNYANLAYSRFACWLKEDIWKCELAAKDVNQVTKDKFWQEVLIAWKLFREKSDMFTEDRHFIWLNSNITISKELVNWSEPYKRGLKWVHQLYPNGQRITYEQANLLFGMSAMELNMLISAIPKRWKRQQPTTEQYVSDYEKVVSIKGISKTVYSSLVSLETGLHAKIQKWEMGLGCEIDPDDYYKSFLQIYCTSNVPKLRSFQYRLMHRAIVLNTQLYKWKMRDDNLCTWCKKNPETIEHFFFDCKETQCFWEDVKDYARVCLHIDIMLENRKNILWNRVHENPMHLSNFIVLLAKQYMYRVRCQNKCISIYQFKAEVYRTKNVEQYIAIKNNNTVKFERKWLSEPGSVSQTAQAYIDEYLRIL